MTKEAVVSDENAKEVRFSLKRGLELNELIDRNFVKDDVGAKIGLRRQRQIIRQKLTEIYWGGVIPELKDITKK